MSTDQLSIALTGPRCSGKNGVATLFKKIGVPVFNADVVLKYIINYDESTVKAVRDNVGKDFVIGDKGLSYIDPMAFDSDLKFNLLLDLVEYNLFESYRKFQEKYKNSIYSVFQTSLLFERGYQKRFKYTISVFSPKEERISRYSMKTGESLEKTHSLFSKEMSEMSKNQVSDFIIHNYHGAEDIRNQVRVVDNAIVDKYFSLKDNLRAIRLDSYLKNNNPDEWIKSVPRTPNNDKFSSVDNHSHAKNMS